MVDTGYKGFVKINLNDMCLSKFLFNKDMINLIPEQVAVVSKLSLVILCTEDIEYVVDYIVNSCNPVTKMRVLLGYTQREMSEMTGIDYNVVVQLEKRKTGLSKCSVEMITSLASFLNINAYDFLKVLTDYEYTWSHTLDFKYGKLYDKFAEQFKICNDLLQIEPKEINLNNYRYLLNKYVEIYFKFKELEI